MFLILAFNYVQQLSQCDTSAKAMIGSTWILLYVHFVINRKLSCCYFVSNKQL
jgi:hypothetical protein